MQKLGKLGEPGKLTCEKANRSRKVPVDKICQPCQLVTSCIVRDSSYSSLFSSSAFFSLLLSLSLFGSSVYALLSAFMCCYYISLSSIIYYECTGNADRTIAIHTKVLM